MIQLKRLFLRINLRQLPCACAVAIVPCHRVANHGSLMLGNGTPRVDSSLQQQLGHAFVSTTRVLVPLLNSPPGITGEIVVTDDLGNIYPDKDSSDPIKDTISAHGSVRYSRTYKNIVDPDATFLEVSIAHIINEDPIQISIPISVSPDQLNVDFTLFGVNGDGFSIRQITRNHGRHPAFIRFTSKIAVNDDKGSQYAQINKDEQTSTLRRK